MEDPTSAPTGFLGSLRVLGDSILASVHDRFELFTVELQEEKFRLIKTFVWICAAVFTGMMAIMFASLTIVYVFWETARLGVLLTLTAIYTGALVAIMVALRSFLARQPKPFSATLHEIGEDRACIQTEN